MNRVVSRFKRTGIWRDWPPGGGSFSFPLDASGGTLSLALFPKPLVKRHKLFIERSIFAVEICLCVFLRFIRQFARPKERVINPSQPVFSIASGLPFDDCSLHNQDIFPDQQIQLLIALTDIFVLRFKFCVALLRLLQRL